MSITDFILRLALSVFLGFIIGIERQLTGNNAGIRINILVCLGTNMFVLFSIIMDTPDVTRIAAQIVSGVGFLCSGIIFKDGVQVRGLNTAATIWCTAAIGVLCSSGNFFYAITAALMLLSANIIFRPVAKIITPLNIFDESEKFYKVSITCIEDKEIFIRAMVMNHFTGKKMNLMNLESTDIAVGTVEIEATFICHGRRRDDMAEKLIEKISLEKGVSGVGWELL